MGFRVKILEGSTRGLGFRVFIRDDLGSTELHMGLILGVIQVFSELHSSV